MQEEFLGSAYINEEEIWAIRNAKLREIKTALDDLFAIGIATNLYKQSSTDRDYKTFEKWIRETFEFSSGDIQSIFNKIDSVLLDTTPNETVFFGIKNVEEDQKIKMIKMLLSLDYTPPHDWREVAGHLLLLEQYYSSDFKYFHPMFEFRFDVSLCKLMAAIGSLSVIVRMDGNELARLKKIKESLKRKVNEKMTYVSQIFHTDLIKKGMKMHFIAIAIRNEFIERQKRGIINREIVPPSVSSIKEYIKQDEGIMRHFNKEGRFWIIKT